MLSEASACAADDEAADKKEEAYSEIVQYLDDKSLSLVMRDAPDDCRKALRILGTYNAGVAESHGVIASDFYYPIISFLGVYNGGFGGVIVCVLKHLVRHYWSSAGSASAPSVTAGRHCLAFSIGGM